MLVYHGVFLLGTCLPVLISHLVTKPAYLNRKEVLIFDVLIKEKRNASYSTFKKKAVENNELFIA